jgi:hypothetical protein
VAKAERKRRRGALTRAEAAKRGRVAMGVWHTWTCAVGSGKAVAASHWLSGRGHGRRDQRCQEWHGRRVIDGFMAQRACVAVLPQPVHQVEMAC